MYLHIDHWLNMVEGAIKKNIRMLWKDDLKRKFLSTNLVVIYYPIIWESLNVIS